VAGADGADGAAGANGVNAYTTTNATDNDYAGGGGQFIVPAVGGDVNVLLVNSSWMVVGQKIFVGGNLIDAVGASPLVVGTGGAYFTYKTNLGLNGVTLTFLGYEDDVAPASIFAAGSGVSPGGTQPSQVTATQIYNYKSVATRDDAFTFPNAYAALAFSGTTQSITLTTAGTWQIEARVRVDYSWADTAGGENLKLKLRRTNNTAQDLDGPAVSTGDTESTFKLEALGAPSVASNYQTAGWLVLPPVMYPTANTNDVISIFGILETLPTNQPDGRLVALEASIVAVRVSDSTAAIPL
jgi:hypothetical protein